MENAEFGIALFVLNRGAMLQGIHQSYQEHSIPPQEGISKSWKLVIVILDGII